MKCLKIILICFAVFAGVVLANGCYFVFWGQHKAARKLADKQELNPYEIISTYTMHLAICIVAPIYGKEVAQEYVGMSFKKNRNSIKYVESDFFLDSPVVRKHLTSLGDKERRIAFKDDCYSLYNPNHSVALAANPGFLKKQDNKLIFRVPLHYPVCINTKIYITRNRYILINESLFNYLEKIGVLHPYTIMYYTNL